MCALEDEVLEPHLPYALCFPTLGDTVNELSQCNRWTTSLAITGKTVSAGLPYCSDTDLLPTQKSMAVVLQNTEGKFSCCTASTLVVFHSSIKHSPSFYWHACSPCTFPILGWYMVLLAALMIYRWQVNSQKWRKQAEKIVCILHNWMHFCEIKTFNKL